MAPNLPVFEKASTASRKVYEFNDFKDDVFVHSKTRGLDDKKYYYEITHTVKDDIERKHIFGYICEEDIN